MSFTCVKRLNANRYLCDACFGKLSLIESKQNLVTAVNLGGHVEQSQRVGVYQWFEITLVLNYLKSYLMEFCKVHYKSMLSLSHKRKKPVVIFSKS